MLPAEQPARPTAPAMRAATSTERGNPRRDRDIHIMPVQPRPVATPCAAQPSRSEAKLLLIQAIARETYYCNMTKARLTPRDARPRLLRLLRRRRTLMMRLAAVGSKVHLKTRPCRAHAEPRIEALP